ncbi:MAG: hypothetical protein NWF07_16195 [Candidatus Bathyarchaeota archaeon]|nr:hypothetical protein [Candidatus Bathyarchaeota archaeon]
MRLSEDALKNLKATLVVIACLYIISGGFYNRIMKPGEYAYWKGNWYTISPDMDEQTTRESFIAFICHLTTFTGIFLMTQSQKRRRLTANRLMILGLVLIIAGLIGSYSLIEVKRLPWYQ